MSDISWNVVALKSYPQYQGETDVVVEVNWMCQGLAQQNGNNYSSRQAGGTSVTLQSGTPFTPYDQLTQEQVLGWVWANGVDKTSTEAVVQADLDYQLSPTIVSTPLPWASTGTKEA